MHFDEIIAQQIFTTFQQSYKVEADFIGTLNFPPLLRSSNEGIQPLAFR